MSENKFRKKPVIIEAKQFDGTNLLKGMDWDMGGAFIRTIHENQQCYVMPGDWIIPEPDGIHYYPCKPDIFKNTHEAVRDITDTKPTFAEYVEGRSGGLLAVTLLEEYERAYPVVDIPISEFDQEHFWNSHKRTFNGVNAGEFIDKEDFEKALHLVSLMGKTKDITESGEVPTDVMEWIE